METVLSIGASLTVAVLMFDAMCLGQSSRLPLLGNLCNFAFLGDESVGYNFLCSHGESFDFKFLCTFEK